ncbi:MAG: dockerin type I domain-containing protein [Candidatus Zixiibacteriota bacterium]
MKNLVKVLVICGFIITAVPHFTSAIDLSRGIILDVPEEMIELQFGEIPLSRLTPQDSIEMAAYRFTGDTLKVLAIMVDWSNRPGTYSRETFDSLLFSRNVFPGGSVADYFYEVSYGQLTVIGEVIDWYDAGGYMGWFDFESLFEELDPVIDYSRFDGNNDGDVDAAVFIRSGNGEEDSHDPFDIWSYAYVYPPGSGPGPFDGMHMPRWNTSPETRPLRDPLNPTLFSGVDSLNRIRVFVHEMTHCIGVPDLYDYDAKLVTSTYYTPGDDNDHPAVDWCVMGYAGYGIFSIGSEVPSHLCGWSKKELGWIDPVILPGGTHNDVVINNVETTKDSSLYLLPIIPAEGEYFLLEYRNPGSTGKFDKIDSDFSCYFWPDLTFAGDSLDRGLLIMHVHDSLGAYYWRINYGTPDYPHYTVAVEDAGYNPVKDTSYNPEGSVTDSAQWWYPYETRRAATFSSDVSGQELFSPTTNPNSDGYSAPSGIVVRVDSIVDDKLYAYIHAPIPLFSLLLPEDSAFVPYVVTFDWEDANPWEELKYDLYVSTSTNFHPDSTVVYDSLSISQHTDTLEVARFYWKVRTYNNSMEQWSTQIWTLLSAIRGDINADKEVAISDVVYLINYLFKSGPEPIPEPVIGDVNCDGNVEITDAVYLVNYLFKSGPPPC